MTLVNIGFSSSLWSSGKDRMVAGGALFALPSLLCQVIDTFLSRLSVLSARMTGWET